MPTSHTITTIMNRALDHVGEFPISSPDDANTYARWLRRNYAPTVESALRQQPWNFAVELHQLNRDPSDPPFRWRYRFKLPNGWLRVLPVTANGSRTGQSVPHAVMGNYLMMNTCSDGNRRNVEIVMNRQNPGEWDSLFAEMIAARLAVGMAHRFTGKSSFLEQSKRAADEALEQAELINAFEGSLDPIEDHEITNVRGYSSGWGGY